MVKFAARRLLLIGAFDELLTPAMVGLLPPTGVIRRDAYLGLEGGTCDECHGTVVWDNQEDQLKFCRNTVWLSFWPDRLVALKLHEFACA